MIRSKMNGALSSSPGSITSPLPATAPATTPIQPPDRLQLQSQPHPTSTLHLHLTSPNHPPPTDAVLRPCSPAPPPPTARAPPSSSPRRPSRPRPSAVVLPAELLHPGVEMLKVSAKSARRVKPRRVWLQAVSTEGGAGSGAGPQGAREAAELAICWEKSGRTVGKYKSCSARYASALKAEGSEGHRVTCALRSRH